MYRIVIGENERCCAFMRARVPGCRSQDDVCIGLERDGQLIACVLYCHYSGHDIEMHTAIDARVTRAWVVAIFAYPFLQLGVARVSTMTAIANVRARKLIHHLGFVREGVRRAACDGEDYIMFGMLAQECKFIQRAAPLVRALTATPAGTIQ
jgi:RimJ/RimL family protein N-acetyltransferase